MADCFLLAQLVRQNWPDFDDTHEWSTSVAQLPDKTAQEPRLFTFLYIQWYCEFHLFHPAEQSSDCCPVRRKLQACRCCIRRCRQSRRCYRPLKSGGSANPLVVKVQHAHRVSDDLHHLGVGLNDGTSLSEEGASEEVPPADLKLTTA
ncbi:hypothetical protein KSP40_PGU013984 [Platanthera guangdongensis]|uniref:Uncharacterized protein n=1 Tax=Platanthera guangdongensis TaxID=2320717 RepID=A0ABR2MV41_9ASPA